MPSKVCEGCKEPMYPKLRESDKLFARRKFHDENCRNAEFRRKKRLMEQKLLGERSQPHILPELLDFGPFLSLDKAITLIPDNCEVLTPFKAFLDGHPRCLHPEGGHRSMAVEVGAVLDRTVVCLGLEGKQAGVRWLEPLAAVCVNPGAFRVRSMALHAAQMRASAKTGRKASREQRMQQRETG